MYLHKRGSWFYKIHLLLTNIRFDDELFNFIYIGSYRQIYITNLILKPGDGIIFKMNGRYCRKNSFNILLKCCLLPKFWCGIIALVFIIFISALSIKVVYLEFICLHNALHNKVYHIGIQIYIEFVFLSCISCCFVIIKF